MDAAINGATFVVHTAAPVGANPRNHQDMIQPSIDGNLLVLKAAAKYNVKRVVITSSVSAVGFVAAAVDTNVYDETCWTDVIASDYSAYNKSKVLAEEAAWNFQKKCEMASVYCPEIVTICPSWVLGEEIAVGAQTSSAIMKKIILNEIPAYPNLHVNWCDVKDVSAAHYRGLVKPEAANSRFIISQPNGITYLHMVTQLHEVLQENGYAYNIKRN